MYRKYKNQFQSVVNAWLQPIETSTKKNSGKLRKDWTDWGHTDVDPSRISMDVKALSPVQKSKVVVGVRLL